MVGAVESRHGLDIHGIGNTGPVHWNYGTPALYEAAVRNNEARVANGGPLVCTTGQHTGRSPRDKFVVRDETTEDSIWWGSVNQPMSPESFDLLYGRALAYVQGRELYVQDCFAGADPEHRLGIRVVTEQAWHNLFARNMFIQPSAAELSHFRPDFLVLQVPGLEAVPEVDGTRSGTVIAVNFRRRVVVIAGTSYAGEIKKSVFTLMNYILPERGIFPMHCSANVGPDGDAAVFFGLSGTGKTTLSADSSRTLIGDDEHGWSATGLFNFEGGCYAKAINLSPTGEPEIYQATTRFGTVLENVVMDPRT